MIARVSAISLCIAILNTAEQHLSCNATHNLSNEFDDACSRTCWLVIYRGQCVLDTVKLCYCDFLRQPGRNGGNGTQSYRSRHCEPMTRTYIRYAVPLENAKGVLSEHLGEAPYFALATVRLSDGRLENQDIHANPFNEVPRAKGIRVAEWLVTNKIDILLIKEWHKGRGPAYVFSNAGVKIHLAQSDSLNEVYKELAELKG